MIEKRLRKVEKEHDKTYTRSNKAYCNAYDGELQKLKTEYMQTEAKRILNVQETQEINRLIERYIESNKENLQDKWDKKPPSEKDTNMRLWKEEQAKKSLSERKEFTENDIETYISKNINEMEKKMNGGINKKRELEVKFKLIYNSSEFTDFFTEKDELPYIYTKPVRERESYQSI